MSDRHWSDVDRLIAETLGLSDPALEAALAAGEEAGLPSIQVSAAQGKLLQLLVMARGARTVLEIGTLGGYSTIWMARGLPEEGRLITLELDERYAAIAGENIARAGVGEKVEIRVGPALATLARLVADGSGPFDVVFIDADKKRTAEYFEWSLRLTAKGGLIVVDNVVRDGDILDATSDDAGAQGVRRFYEMMGANRRVSATAIQTVGVKGWDGFALAVVTG